MKNLFIVVYTHIGNIQIARTRIIRPIATTIELFMDIMVGRINPSSNAVIKSIPTILVTNSHSIISFSLQVPDSKYSQTKEYNRKYTLKIY